MVAKPLPPIAHPRNLLTTYSTFYHPERDYKRRSASQRSHSLPNLARETRELQRKKRLQDPYKSLPQEATKYPYYPYTDFEYFQRGVANLLSKLANWDLWSEEELRSVVSIVYEVANSKIQNIFARPRFLELLLYTVSTSANSLDVCRAGIAAIFPLCQDHKLKLELVEKRRLDRFLLRVVRSTLSDDELTHAQEIVLLAFKCLETLLCAYSDIIDEKRAEEQCRRTFLARLGLVELLLYSKSVRDETYVQESLCLIDCFRLEDVRLQRKLLDKLLRDRKRAESALAGGSTQ